MPIEGHSRVEEELKKRGEENTQERSTVERNSNNNNNRRAESDFPLSGGTSRNRSLTVQSTGYVLIQSYGGLCSGERNHLSAKYVDAEIAQQRRRCPANDWLNDHNNAEANQIGSLPSDTIRFCEQQRLNH